MRLISTNVNCVTSAEFPLFARFQPPAGAASSGDFHDQFVIPLISQLNHNHVVWIVGALGLLCRVSKRQHSNHVRSDPRPKAR